MLLPWCDAGLEALLMATKSRTFLMAFSRTEKRFGTWALKCFGLQAPNKRFLGATALAFLEHWVASVRRNTLCNNARDKSEIGLLLLLGVY